MSQRDKLIARMNLHPRKIHFSEVDALLRSQGFVVFNKRGGHYTYHHPTGTVLTIVRPHGKHKTCHPTDIRKLLKVFSV